MQVRSTKNSPVALRETLFNGLATDLQLPAGSGLITPEASRLTLVSSRLFSRLHAAVQPPSTTSSAPVTNDASSLARNSTHQPTSSDWAPRFIGVRFIAACTSSGAITSSIGVRMGPGCTELTRILSGAY